VHRHLATCPAVKWRAISSTKTEERASDEDSSREGERGQRDLLSTISPTTNNASTAKGKTEGTDKEVCGSTKHIGGNNNSHTDTLSREVIGPAGSDDSDAEFGMSDLSLVSDEASVSDDDGESVHITTIREQSSTGNEIRGPPSAPSERHWMWEYLPTKFRTGKYAMSSTLLAFMEKRVSKGTSYGHKKAFLQYVEFLKTEKVLAPGLDVSPFLLEPLKKEEKSVLMRRFIIFVAGVLGKKEEMMTAFLGQLRSNWVVAGIKTSFLAFTKDEAKEIKKSAKRSRAEEKARLDRQAHNEKEALRMYMIALLRDKCWVEGEKELKAVQLLNRTQALVRSEGPSMDKMTMYNASAIHSEIGPRGDQIGFSKAETGEHQVILAGDVVFRVGVGEPNQAGIFGCVVDMNGWRLWKWITGDLG
jgi:hypothetical protein